MKILIIGAGPTGIGAALRLQQAGFEDWEILEQEDRPGGLSRSFIDSDGFTWDLGGHVQFSHYGSFDRAMTLALGEDGWVPHQRQSWIHCCGAWVPYPFQYNIHRLPPEPQSRCFQGLVEAAERGPHAPWNNFRELIDGCFGRGLAELFMVPYNDKVWGCPPEELAVGWVGDRVAMPDLKKITESIALERDNVAWGPNDTFRFPRRGGTGAIWTALAARLPQEKIHYGRRVGALDLERRLAIATDGVQYGYDALISAMPLDRLVGIAGLERESRLAARLRFSGTHVIGVALRGRPSPLIAPMCWMYLPRPEFPFYRVTVFSNYSPANVPDPTSAWSLMAEVTHTPRRPADPATVVERTIQGLLDGGLIQNREEIHHTWTAFIERSYPTPALDRDEILADLLPRLESQEVYSRGRFGAWRYEVGNQDHAFAQGSEAAVRILFGTPELTVWFPNLVNNLHPVYGKNWL